MEKMTKKEFEQLKKELFELLLKKVDAKKEDVYDDAVRRWINGHKSLLTDDEKMKYGRILSL